MVEPEMWAFPLDTIVIPLAWARRGDVEVIMPGRVLSMYDHPSELFRPLTTERLRLAQYAFRETRPYAPGGFRRGVDVTTVMWYIGWDSIGRFYTSPPEEKTEYVF